MKKVFYKTLNYLFFLGLGIFMVVWSLKDIELKKLLTIVEGASLVYVLPVLIIILLSHYVRALRWNLLLGSLGYKPNPFKTFLAIMIGYFTNLFIPRVGEVLRCTVVAKYENIPPDKIVGTVLLERIVDLLCLLILTVLAFLLQIDLVGNFFKEKVFLFFSLDKVIRYGIILLGIVVVVVLALRAIKKFTFFARIKKILEGVKDGMKTIFHLKQKFYFFVLSFVMWFLYLFGTWLGFQAIHETAFLGFVSTLSALVLGSVGMIVTQGGVGAYPLLIQQVVMWYGVDKAIGAASGWLNWTVQFLASLVFGAISWMVLPIYHSFNTKNKNVKS